MEKEMTYLVPYDFSPVADAAVKMALQVADIAEGSLQLLHVVKSDKEIEAAEEKFEGVRSKLSIADNRRLSTKVVTGNIFKDIPAMAEDNHAKLIIMGTHGAKGLQKLFGSHALKVISGSHTPLIVVQDKVPAEGVRKIVMPVGLDKETTLISSIAKNIAAKFGAEVHIVVKRQTDEWLVKKIVNNVLQVKASLAKDGVNSSCTIMEGKDSFYKEVMEHAHGLGADMFALGYFNDSLLPDAFTQSLITNEDQIPVLVVNAESLSSVSSQYSFITV
jgi:nucleotide-binding universal stress UspA family protein